jgi:hypothetical protein
MIWKAGAVDIINVSRAFRYIPDEESGDAAAIPFNQNWHCYC